MKLSNNGFAVFVWFTHFHKYTAHERAIDSSACSGHMPTASRWERFVRAKRGAKREGSLQDGCVAMVMVAAWLVFALVCHNVNAALPASAPHTVYHLHLVQGRSPITEPYPPLSGGAFSGTPVPLSPDPLVAYQWRHPQGSDGLQYYVLRPAAVSTQTPGAFLGLKSALTSQCDITVQGAGAIRVDFGTECAAWIEFDSPDFNGGRVKMGVSEFKAEAHDGRPVRGGWLPAVATPEKIHNTYRLKLNPQYYEGVRFGWIYVRNFNGKPWHITAIRAVCQIKPTNYNGSFSCSNPMLTRIWYTGAYTVKLNLLKRYFCAILMDRGDRISWVGDAHVAQSAAMAAFGNFGFVRHNLNISAGKGNGIASYYLYWVLSLVDYYRATGDAVELRRYYPVVEKLLAGGAANFAQPRIGFYGWGDRLGGGFANAQTPQACQAYRMLFVETCRRFAGATASAGDKDASARYTNLADKYAAKIQSQPTWVRQANIFAASDGINAGVPTVAQVRTLYRRCFANRLDRLALSPFNEYFVVEAMARMQLWDSAMETVLDDWGGQINYGGTTFFETYRPSWNYAIAANAAIPSMICGPTSLCHPWSAGCTTWLTRWVAGICPVTPGFGAADIVPHLGRNLTWVKATVPTPHGSIVEKLNVQTGKGRYSIPAGVVARIGLPLEHRRINLIEVNGRPAWRRGKFLNCPGIGGAVQSSHFVYLTSVKPGQYAITVAYQGRIPPFLPQPFIYPVSVLGQDATTQGNWGGVYGRDGYVLLADGPNQTDVEHLPAYVKSVRALWNHSTQWPSNGSDPRALADSPANSRQHRTAGVVYSDLTSQAPHAAMDIRLTHQRSYRLALYAVDFDRKNRKQTITLEDLRTKKLLAPVQVFSHFAGGKYMVFQCHGSVRVRFDPIRGGNAVLSGIFFDPPGG